jgi:hypothetical protein
MSPQVKVGPPDFAPYRAEFSGCSCPLCNEVAYAGSDVLDMGGRRHLTACAALLDALRAGTHQRVELAEYVAAAKVEKAARIAEACRTGAGEQAIAVLERGYSTSRDKETYPYGSAGPMQSREFVIGSGLGMTAGAYERRVKAWDQRVSQANAERAIQVERLIQQDARNKCTYYRIAGKLCDHHRGES